MVTAEGAPAAQAEALCRAIDGGAGVVQLRNKTAGKGTLLAAARRVADYARLMGAVFVVNDDVDLAVAARADGVHLGQDDLPIEVARALWPGGAVGLSTHDLEQAWKRAAEAGADYIGVGPVYATPTKPGRAPVGHHTAQRVVARLGHPPLVRDRGIDGDHGRRSARRWCHTRRCGPGRRGRGRPGGSRSRAEAQAGCARGGGGRVSASLQPEAAPTVAVNGKPVALGDVRNLGDLLARLEIRPQRVVVELNGQIYRRGEGLEQPVGADDVVEIVHFVGGG